eukprot:PhF_6_TR10573/c0_g1_i2/m.16849
MMATKQRLKPLQPRLLKPRSRFRRRKRVTAKQTKRVSIRILPRTKTTVPIPTSRLMRVIKLQRTETRHSLPLKVVVENTFLSAQPQTNKNSKVIPRPLSSPSLMNPWSRNLPPRWPLPHCPVDLRACFGISGGIPHDVARM